ncbi:MAG: hypothetical protein EBQ53_04540, partial [Betaproteobacteria bacterium]|nr:hypothetical protein [Betaproteobacteria bacterium]
MFCLVRGEDAVLLARTLDSLQRQLYSEWSLVVLAESQPPSDVFNTSDYLGWFQLDSLHDPLETSRIINTVIAELGQGWASILPVGFELDENAFLVMGITYICTPNGAPSIRMTIVKMPTECSQARDSSRISTLIILGRSIFVRP